MAWTTPRTWVSTELVTAGNMNTHIRDDMLSMLPLACYIDRAGNATSIETTLDGRFLECNGVAVSRTTYADLFGYYNGLTPALPFGVGDASTTFNLPDFRGRFGVYEGTHADVTLGDNDGDAVADRTPNHGHTPYTVTELGPAGSGTFLMRTIPVDTGAFLVGGVRWVKFTRITT